MSKAPAGLDVLLEREPTVAAELRENSSYYRPLLEKRRREQVGRPKLPCFVFGGHDWHWLDPRKDYGTWLVKKVCERCPAERDYQIGTSSEDGHRWSSEGGSSPPPRKYWALRARD